MHVTQLAEAFLAVYQVCSVSQHKMFNDPSHRFQIGRVDDHERTDEANLLAGWRRIPAFLPFGIKASRVIRVSASKSIHPRISMNRFETFVWQILLNHSANTWLKFGIGTWFERRRHSSSEITNCCSQKINYSGPPASTTTQEVSAKRETWALINSQKTDKARPNDFVHQVNMSGRLICQR